MRFTLRIWRQKNAKESGRLVAYELGDVSPDVAYTLNQGRKAFAYRRTLVCSDIKQAVSALESNDSKRVFTSLLESGETPVTFMFSGQGSQYVNMGRDLYQVESTFREQVDTCAEILRPHLGLDLRRVLYPDEADAGEAAARLLRPHDGREPLAR